MGDAQVVLVHGIRTSATMWRAQVSHLQRRGVGVHAIDLPGHGSRIDEPWSLDEAFATIDRAVRSAAREGPALLVAHSMGGLLSLALLGSAAPPPVAGFVGAGCTAVPRGAGLRLYRTILRSMRVTPRRGLWLAERVLAATLPEETRTDFAAGGYALAAEDAALASLAGVDLLAALPRIAVPTWLVNGEWDQLRAGERLFTRLLPHAELIVVPRSTHLVTAMRPRVFNAVVDLALASVDRPSPDA
jgi:pimeloyl-ACP methyl ester carboxylesterase